MAYSVPRSAQGRRRGNEAAFADSILTDVLHRGTVRIAITTGAPPTRFEDENGTLQGYDIGIATLLAKQLGVTIDYIKTDTAGRVAMLQTKKADITIASFTPNLERLKSVGFTDPYLTDVLTLMSRADRKDLGSLADFNKPEIKVAIPRGSTAAKALAKYSRLCASAFAAARAAHPPPRIAPVKPPPPGKRRREVKAADGRFRNRMNPRDSGAKPYSAPPGELRH
jgi:hypothetical protein